MKQTKSYNQKLIQSVIENGPQPLYEIFNKEEVERTLSGVTLENTLFRGKRSQKSLSIKHMDTGQDLACIFGLDWKIFADKYLQATSGDGQEARRIRTLHNYARVQNATLTKPIVKQIIADVLGAGGEYPAAQEPQWKKMLKERGLSKARYFEHFKGGKYKLIGFGKDSETLEDVVIYQALYGAGQIWVRPYDIFFSKVTLPDGTEVERFKEISSNELM